MELDEAQSSYAKFVDEKNLFPARAETQFPGRLPCPTQYTNYNHKDVKHMLKHYHKVF